MPTLTIDLPDAAYRAALDLPATERTRRVASVFADAEDAADEESYSAKEKEKVAALFRGIILPTESNPETVARLREEAKVQHAADTALFAQWEVEAAAMTPEEREADSRAFEKFMVNIDAPHEQISLPGCSRRVNPRPIQGNPAFAGSQHGTPTRK